MEFAFELAGVIDDCIWFRVQIMSD